MFEPDDSKQWAQVVAKAWADDKFKAKLLDNPAATLAEHRLTVPPGVQIKVVENTRDVIHVTLPAKTSVEELLENELVSVSPSGRAASRAIPGDTCSLTYFPRAARGGGQINVGP